MRPVFVLAVMVVAACSGPATASASPSASLSPGSSAPPSPGSSARPVALSTGGIVEYPVPATPSAAANCLFPCVPVLGSLAAGPDGTIWYVDGGRGLVGRVAPAGNVVQFAMPVSLAGGAQTIAAGPDHNMWVLGRGTGQDQPDWILRVSPAGDVTKFPTTSLSPGVESIAAGPDGNLWFTEFGVSRIGKVTTSGAVTEYGTVAPNSNPRGIVAGADGNLWFAETNRERNAIGRISPQGLQSDFPLNAGPSDAAPNDVAAGPDGNIWFTRWAPGGLGHISANGAVVDVALPQGSSPTSLVAGPDGNIWFTDSPKNMIGRISVAGAIREFPLPRRAGGPYGIALGGDGRIWFGDGGSIGSIGLKVPELSFSQPDNTFGRQVVVYADASSHTFKVANTGDGALAFGTARVTGVDQSLFVKSADTCSDHSLPPGASCVMSVAHTTGGPPGVQSAFLELPDNATGSPQKISLVAQPGSCRLPISVSVPNQPNQGFLLDLSTGHGVVDPAAGFETSTSPPGVRTTALPPLFGWGSAYFDRAQSRWLPVFDRAAVSPDGSRYAYTSSDPNNPGPNGIQLHIVDVAAAKDRMVPLPQGFWAIVAFGSRGVYLNQRYEGIGPGLELVDTTTGAMTRVLDDGVVGAVDGTTAWAGTFNTADKLPGPPGMGGGSNEIDRRDLATGSTTPWFYAPGANLYVVGLIDGSPLISVSDAVTAKLVLVRAPNQAQEMAFPFATGQSSYGGFVGDRTGTWIGAPEGVYLWTSRTGPILVSSEPAAPAGTCA